MTTHDDEQRPCRRCEDREHLALPGPCDEHADTPADYVNEQHQLRIDAMKPIEQPTDQKAPRGWTLRYNYTDEDHLGDWYGPHFDEPEMHVIEKSYADALKAENISLFERLNERITQLSLTQERLASAESDLIRLREHKSALSEQVLPLTQERDQLRARVALLEGLLAEIAPSWLPEAIRDKRREALGERGG